MIFTAAQTWIEIFIRSGRAAERIRARGDKRVATGTIFASIWKFYTYVQLLTQLRYAGR